MMVNNYEILGDSGDYEFLTEAVELSKDVYGMCAEIGVRRGLGTKTIIDATIAHRPNTTVISIDPYGSILYTGREPDGPCRLDYTTDMGKECMVALSEYVLDKPVYWKPFLMTDTFFFKSFPSGIELYELETILCNKYAMVHLDGPHTVAAVKAEIDFFFPRMDIGATIVFDDVTPDFYDHSQIEDYIADKFEIIRTGGKKQIVQKIAKGMYV